ELLREEILPALDRPKTENRQIARRFASDALRCLEEKAAGDPGDGVTAGGALRQRPRSLAQPAKALRFASGRARTRSEDKGHPDVGGRLSRGVRVPRRAPCRHHGRPKLLMWPPKSKVMLKPTMLIWPPRASITS